MAETKYSNELYHYGVLGMKGGVRRAAAKARSEPKLKKRALNYDKKSAKLTKKSEHLHDKNDLEGRNRAARKMAKYRIKEAKVSKKALKAATDSKQLRYEQKAAKTRLKLANNQRYINMTKRRMSDIQSDPKYQATISELRKKYGSVLG